MPARTRHLTLSAALLLASSFSAQAASTIKIGVIAPLSGPSSNLGLQMKNAAQLAINDLKADLARAGLNVQLVAYDDQGDPATGTAAARRVAADKAILGIIGTQHSGVSIPVSAALAPSHVAMISPANTSPKVTDRGLKNMNRVCARDDAQGPAGATFLLGTLKAKKVYVLNDKTPYGQGLADQAEKELRARGVNIVQSEGVSAEERDFTAIITKIRTLKPDAIYFGGIYGQAGPFLRQLRDKGLTLPVMGGDGFDSPDLIKLAGTSAANNVYYTTVAPPLESLATVKTAAAQFKKTFGSDLQSYGVLGYDAARIMLTAILNATKANGGQVPSRAQVEQAVRAGTYRNLLTGEVKFNKDGDRQSAKMYVIALKNSKLSTAETMTITRK